MENYTPLIDQNGVIVKIGAKVQRTKRNRSGNRPTGTLMWIDYKDKMIRVKFAADGNVLVTSPGNYGLRFLEPDEKGKSND